MIKEETLVSLIISMYKGEKYIAECIDSVLKQDYSNIELILIDDGSPDNCGKIAESYAKKDSRVKIVHQENKGVSASRNIGLATAKGEYVGIIDQDDIISSDYVSYFMKLIKENNAQIALVPTADKFFEKINQPSQTDNVQVWSGQRAAEEMLYHKIIIGPWNKLIKRSLLTDNNVKFNPNFFGGEGFAFSVQAYQYADHVAVGKRNVYHYRVGDPETGASKFRPSSIESSLNAQIFIKNTFVKSTPMLNKAWEFSNWHTYCDCLNVMVGSGATKKYPELYNKLATKCKKEAFVALKAPISAQQKIRGILFKISPYFAAKVINFFRIRNFQKA